MLTGAHGHRSAFTKRGRVEGAVHGREAKRRRAGVGQEQRGSNEGSHEAKPAAAVVRVGGRGSESSMCVSGGVYDGTQACGGVECGGACGGGTRQERVASVERDWDDASSDGVWYAHMRMQPAVEMSSDEESGVCGDVVSVAASGPGSEEHSGAGAGDAVSAGRTAGGLRRSARIHGQGAAAMVVEQQSAKVSRAGSDGRWVSAYLRLRRWREEHRGQGWPSRRSKDVEERQLGQWLSNQRRHFKGNLYGGLRGIECIEGVTRTRSAWMCLLDSGWLGHQ